MPSRNQRITNGHRAAVCGLVIAGLPMIESCRIVGAPYLAVVGVLPKGWHVRGRRPSRWTGDLIDELREAWFDPAQRVFTIASRYGVTTKAIQLVARKQGWPRRRRWRIEAPGPAFRDLSADQRRVYFKLRRQQLTYAQAIAGAVA